MNKVSGVFVFLLLFVFSSTYAQQFSYATCHATLTGDTLIIGNGEFNARYLWNQGNIKLVDFVKTSRMVFKNKLSPVEDFFLPGEVLASSGTFTAREVKRSPLEQSFLQVEINFMMGSLSVRRIFEISPDVPALRTYYYLKGTSAHLWGRAVDKQNGLIENPALLAQQSAIARLGNLALPGSHWKLRAVEFTDVTDQNNTLVHKKSYTMYRRPISLTGNLLFAENQTSNTAFFILKESPASGSQLAFPGFDFMVADQRVSISGLGLESTDVHEQQWTRTYGYVMGVTDANELSELIALRAYQKSSRAILTQRDEMVLMNTWGDRGQDSRINEAFVLKELEHAKQLGVTHLQLDDGWQAGTSKNSSVKSGQLWDTWKEADWQPHPVRFPNGFKPVVDKAKSLGIEIGLWFNPGSDNHYVTWERDARILTNYYTRWGIRTFKIDGVNLPDKTSEENLRKLAEKVMVDTHGAAIFNFDVTAGVRPGYHYFNEYGNIFLENRYTDWGNYYPYWTLRNLWMLSSYVPPERLQIEFLNAWRNSDKYAKDDDLAPSRIPFDYLTAITLMAQPLAWLEGSNLPAEAFKTGALLTDYKKIQHELHSGTILPIGNEPDGYTWTGFQSLQDGKGYVLIFREHHVLDKQRVKTWLPKGKQIEFTSVLGQGKSFTSVVGDEGLVEFQLPSYNSFALYRYQIK